MKLKNSLKKKILTSLLVGASLTGFVSSNVFAYSNSSDGEYASKEASDKIINEIKQAYNSRSATSHLTYEDHHNPCCFVVHLRGNTYGITSFGRCMVKTYEIDGKTYYFDPYTLRAEKGWYNVTDSSKHNGRYYFDPETCIAYEDGVREVGYEKFYFDDKGRVCKGLTHAGGKTYFGDSRAGVLVKGWYSTSGHRYLFDQGDNSAHTGWYEDGNAGYMHFNSDGAMSTGVTKVSDCSDKSKNGIYLFRPHGNGANTYVTTGYYSDTMTDKRYYFKPNTGKATTNEWLQTGRGYMYFGEDGAMAKGVTEIGNDTFVFTKGGGRDCNYYRDLGWYTDDETDARYYFGGYRGEALKGGVYCIDGCNCRFNDEGIFQGYVSNY